MKKSLLFVIICCMSCGKSNNIQTKYYTDTGTIMERIISQEKSGKKCVEKFSKAGVLREEYCLLNEVVHGEVKFYDEVGNIKVIQSFSNGFENGYSKKFYETGNLKEEAMFLNGQQNGPQFYYLPDGKLRAKHIFRNDTAIFKKIISYEENDSIRSIFYQIMTSISLRDTVTTSEFIEVTIKRPVFPDDEIAFEAVSLMYDFVEKSSNHYGKVFPYPRFMVPFEGDVASDLIKIKKAGDFIIYGNVEFSPPDSRDSVVSTFYESITIKQD